MKKLFTLGAALLMIFLFAVPSSAYILSPEEIYGEPEKSYEEGYEEGFENGGGTIIYRTREVSAKEYIADHATRFRELYITALLVLGICAAPILVFRYAIIHKPLSGSAATAVTVIYNLAASAAITYIMYRINYLVPCMSVVILWAILCRRILAE